jgi:UDP-N-acetyl-L-fucosamine synthase
MKKLKVMTILGTRPEIIRLSRVIRRLDEDCDHILVHTGQNFDFELNEIFFQELNIRTPDHFLAAAGKTPMQTIGNVIISIDELLERDTPDAVLVLGDTNSCISLFPAKRRKIPTFHMEAGNRCFDMRVPEEINRKLVDHIADINLTYSNIARQYLIAEGLPPDQVIKTGSPMYEVLLNQKDAIDNSIILEDLNLRKYSFFLISAHREENIETSNFVLLINCLNEIAETFSLPIIVSTHPRTRKKIEEGNVYLSSFIKILKPLGFNDYNKLQLSAKAVLSDSGTINEESSILNFPALNIRETHERPEAMEETSVMMVGLNRDRILQGIKILEKQSRERKKTLNPVADYQVPNVSEKILRILHSYTDYVNRVTWKKF